MRTRVKTTPRTWLLIAIAVIASGVIAWTQQRSREAERPAIEPAPTPAPATDEVEIELVE